MTVNQKKAHELTMICLNKFYYREELLSVICKNEPVKMPDRDFELYNATYQAALRIIDQLNPVNE